MVVNPFSYSFLTTFGTTNDATNSEGLLISVRRAYVEDVPSLASILTDSFHPPTGLNYWIYPLLKMGVSEDLRGRLRSNSPNYSCLVATARMVKSGVRQNVIVGTVELSMRSNYSARSGQVAPHPYVANLAVAHSYRRKGAARLLLDECDRLAKTWGFSEISLHVLENNDRAQKLYFDRGYQLLKTESSLGSWFCNSPKRLLLSKQIQDRS